MKKHKKNEIVGSSEVIFYTNPGLHLNDLELMKMYQDLISLNKKHGIQNGLLEPNLILSEVRDLYQSIFIAIMYNDGNAFGLNLTPVILRNGKPIVHAGLYIINENPGGDFVAFTAGRLSTITYEKYGKYFVTNITSTPAACETFTNFIPNCWPNPNQNQRRAPVEYLNVLKIIKKEYIDEYFEGCESIEIDYLRFTMTSKSKDMGFKHDLKKSSQAPSLMFNLFCDFWLDYEKEEDMIQVGSYSRLNYYRTTLFLFFLKLKLRKIKTILGSKNSNQDIKIAA